MVVSKVDRWSKKAYGIFLRLTALILPTLIGLCAAEDRGRGMAYHPVLCIDILCIIATSKLTMRQQLDGFSCYSQ